MPRALHVHRQLRHTDHRPSGARLPLIIVLDDVRDALNVGAVFRAADAFGAARVVLCGQSATPGTKGLQRTARLTDRAVPWETAPDIGVALAELAEGGHQLIGLELTDHSVPLDQLEITPGRPLVLVAGAEDHGVCMAALECCEAVAHIPMRGENSSMNVATAVAIAAYVLSTRLLSGAGPR